MTELLDEISALLDASGGDLERIERTLTDGYAHALSLEAEGKRISRQIGEIAHEIGRGDTAGKAKELTALTARLDGNANELLALRRRLVELRRHADAVRV
jgi:hypothetical protein